MFGGLVLEEEDLLKLLAPAYEVPRWVAPLRRLGRLRRPKRNKLRDQQGNIKAHYDVGNGYYQRVLDDEWFYSCAHRVSPDDTLDEAQRNKVQDTLTRLDLQPGHTLLDIGCGWGGLLIAAAKQYGVEGLGITLSDQQLARCRQQAKLAGVDHLVRFEKWNYLELRRKLRQLGTKWRRVNRIVSVGMFEHVGRGQARRFFKLVRHLLEPDGIMLLHTITKPRDEPTDPFVDKWIFPGGYLPTVQSLYSEINAVGMWPVRCVDWSGDYGWTLRQWWERHRKNRSAVEEMFDEKFYLARSLWMAGSILGFESGRLGLARIVFAHSKKALDTYPQHLKN
jgi:cyclopropane-fatty-acyl-phospholipid synthase